MRVTLLAFPQERASNVGRIGLGLYGRLSVAFSFWKAQACLIKEGRRPYRLAFNRYAPRDSQATFRPGMVILVDEESGKMGNCQNERGSEYEIQSL